MFITLIPVQVLIRQPCCWGITGKFSCQLWDMQSHSRHESSSLRSYQLPVTLQLGVELDYFTWSVQLLWSNQQHAITTLKILETTIIQKAYYQRQRFQVPAFKNCIYNHSALINIHVLEGNNHALPRGNTGWSKCFSHSLKVG